MEQSGEKGCCRNCGLPLEGMYCHGCGQSSAIIRRPTKEVLDDALGGIFHWDSRLVHTLRLLFLRPGQLSLEWVSGRRARYVPPFRLYIIASFILFLLLGISTGRMTDGVQFVETSEDSLQQLQVSIDKAREDGQILLGIFLQGALEAAKDPAAYVRKIVTNLPKAAFLFLPLFALLHMGVNLRKGRFYIDYLVFSLHLHAFAFSLFSLVLITGLVTPALGQLLGLLYLAIPVYGLIAFRNFNEEGWGKSLLKSILVYGVYSALLGLGLAFFFAAALFL